MSPHSENKTGRAAIDAVAAEWVLRRDRGLTAAEQDELSQWLAADPRHGAALAEHRWGWDELDRLTGLQTSLGAVPDPDLLARRPAARARRRWWLAAGAGLAAAAMVAVTLALRPSREAAGRMSATVSSALCERLALDDGSVIELNRGAAAETAYSPKERRVRLVRGEASFTVAKDAARPFIVSAGGIEVRAVGTVFNVRLDHAAVEVVVSEGRVKVNSPGAVAVSAEGTLLSVGQSTVVSLAPASPPPQPVTLAPAQLAARLAWQPRLLDFTDAPLTDIVAEFNRRNPVQLALGDPGLAAVRLSATFRSDNVEGFVRLMESDFGMSAEWRNGREIVLRRR